MAANVTGKQDQRLVAPRDLSKELAQKTAEFEAMRKERDALKAQLKPPAGPARAVEADPRGNTPRDFGLPDEPMAVHQLLAAVLAAERVELAFANGQGIEVIEIAPRIISGAAWKVVHNAWLRLQVPSLQVHGSACGSPPLQIGQYVLLTDGTVVAQTRRSNVLHVMPGTTVELKDDIAF